MNVEVGDSVRVDGRVAKIVSKIAAGKHTRFVLSDGRQVLDICKMVKDGAAVIISRGSDDMSLPEPEEDEEDEES